MDMVPYVHRDATAQRLSRTKYHEESTTNNLHEKPKIPFLPSSYFDDEFPYPFGKFDVDLTELELREIAYEILVGDCRSSTSSRPLKFVSSSERSSSSSMMSSPSFQRSVTSTAASKVNKALGLKSRKKNSDSVVSGNKKGSTTVGELMRVQMRVSETTNSRVRRAFIRVAIGLVSVHLFFADKILFDTLSFL